jgi:hypothetical protein
MTAQTQNKRTQISMPGVEFEPTIPVLEREKTVHALNRAATVIGWSINDAVRKASETNPRNIGEKKTFKDESRRWIQRDRDLWGDEILERQKCRATAVHDDDDVDDECPCSYVAYGLISSTKHEHNRKQQFLNIYGLYV